MPTSPTQVRVNLTIPKELHGTLHELAQATPGQTVSGLVKDMLMQQHGPMMLLAAALRVNTDEDAQAAFGVMRTMVAQLRAAADMVEKQVDGYEQVIEIEKQAARKRSGA
jgi:hypothetical protein